MAEGSENPVFSFNQITDIRKMNIIYKKNPKDIWINGGKYIIRPVTDLYKKHFSYLKFCYSFLPKFSYKNETLNPL